MLYAILFLILRLPSLFEPYWYGDEGIYLTLGQGIRHGLLLYQQIHDNKPPTLYYLAALAHTVFGFRLLLTLFMIPTIYFFHRLAKRFLSPKLTRLSTLTFLLLTSIPLIEGNMANAEVFMLLPTILAFYIFYKSSVSGLPAKTLVSAGLLLGLAFTIKVPVAVEFVLLCLWLFIFSRQKIKKNHYFWSFFYFPHFFICYLFCPKRGLSPFSVCGSPSKFRLFIFLGHRYPAKLGHLRWSALAGFNHVILLADFLFFLPQKIFKQKQFFPFILVYCHSFRCPSFRSTLSSLSY